MLTSLIGDREVVQEGITGSNWALGHECWSVGPVGMTLEYAMPVLWRYVVINNSIRMHGVKAGTEY